VGSRSALLLLLAGLAHAAPAAPDRSPAGVVEGRVLRGGRPLPHAAVLIDAPGAPLPPLTARVDEVELSFVPKMQVAPIGSTLRVKNADVEAHTVHGVAAGRTLFHRASVPGEPEAAVALPVASLVTLTCELHSYMRAFVVVTGTRFFAVTDLEGRFRIAGVPAGPHPVRVVPPDPAPPSPGEPGQTVAIADPAQPGPLEITLAPVVPEPEAALPAGPPHRHTHTRLPDWLTRLGSRPAFPSSKLAVLLLSALGIVVGMFAAIANLRLARRRRWPLGLAVFTGGVLALLLGMTFLVGLHGAIATALGFGAFIGTALFGASYA